MTSDRRYLVWSALGIVYLVWGSTYLAIRVVVREAPPLLAMGTRFLVAATILATILGLRFGFSHLRLGARQALATAFLGLMLPCLGNGMVSVAESHGEPSGVTALLIAMVPLLIVVYRSLGGDRPRRLTLVGVLLGFVGLAVLVITGGHGAAQVPLVPSLVVVFAASCWALGSYLQPRLWLPRDVLVTAVYEMAFGGFALVVLGAVTGERFSGSYDARTWLALGYLVVFGSVVAFTSYVWLVANAPISFVATYAYVNPMVAVFLGWLILSEPVTAAIFVGGGIVVLAVAVVIGGERPRAPRLSPGRSRPEGRPRSARAGRTAG